MNRASRFLVALLILCGCLSFQNKATAQSKEQSKEQAEEIGWITSEPPTVTLTAIVNPIMVEEVSFEGLQNLPEADVLQAFRENRVVKAHAALEAGSLEKGVKIIKQLLDDRGYLKSTVEVSVVNVAARSRAVKFIVTEGEAFSVNEIRFEGNRVFTNDELRSQLKLVNTSGQDVFDRSVLEYDLNNVRNYMRSKGYLTAKTGEAKEQLINGGVSITVPVEEGPIYRLGHFSISGAKLFTSEQIIELIGLKPGDIADGKAISDALFKDLRQRYVNNGYIDYDADLEPEYSVNGKMHQGVVDFKIEIREGQAYKISSIEFVGNKQITTEELRRYLLIREGEVFNEQRLEESINNLNSIAPLEEIDKEEAVDFQKDEDSAQVKLIIKVREIQDQQSP